MHALGPGAFGEIFDDAARHAAGDAERVDDLLLRRGRAPRATPAAAPIAPNTAVGWKPALCTAFGTTVDSRHITSQPTAMPRARRRRPRLCRSQAASTAGTITAPACTGPPSKVSSKSSPCAAVPLTNAAPAALSVRAWPIAVHGPVVVAGRRARLDVVLVARGDAEADDVDQQIVAFRRAPPAAGARRAAPAMRSASCSATEDLAGSLRVHRCCQDPAQRTRAEAGNAVDGDHHREGDDQHAEADHRDGAEIAALVEVVDQHRDHLGLRGEQDDRRRQFAHHADEDEAPGRDHAGAQQRRGDLPAASAAAWRRGCGWRPPARDGWCGTPPAAADRPTGSSMVTKAISRIHSVP